MHLEFTRNGVFIAIVAHALIGISLIWDKVLLRQPATRDLVSYVFWLGAISIFGLALIPFGYHTPPFRLGLLAFGTGALHLVAVFFYYAALNAGEASQTLAIMGGFSPTATALFGIALLPYPVGRTGLPGFVLLTLGGFAMFLSEKMNWRRVLPHVIASSVCFGLVNVLEKVVYNSTHFVTGYVYFTLGTFAGAMALLARSSWRKRVFQKSQEASPRSRLWYFVNRFLSGVGSFLIFFAISRANPAVVDAIAGVRYAIIFLGALLLTKFKPVWLAENFSRHALIGKAAGTALVVAGLVVLALTSPGEPYSASSTTPPATSEAPAQRFQLTRSLSTTRASSVSSR